jgi:hypothetical protein
MQDGAQVKPFQFSLAFVFCRNTNCATEVQRIVSSGEDVYHDHHPLSRHLQHKCACL